MADFLSIPQHQLTLSGNTAGALAALSSGTVTIAGGNNITVSQAGNAITISGANAGGAQTAISGIANSETTYTSGTVSLSELGAITIRSTTGQQFQFSVNAQSVQPETQTFIGGISASDTLYTSGTVRFTGVGGGVTVSSNTGQRVDISVAAQSVQPETQTFIGGISASDTLYTSGTVRFTGVGGGITVSTNTGQRVDLSVAAQSVQPETQTFVAGIGNSETTYTSGTVNLSVVAGQLTIRSTTGQAFQFSASQSVQPETQTFIGGIANSETTYTSGSVTLSALGALTIRSTTGQHFQFSVNSQTVQTQGGFASMGVSTGGNTSGDTTVNTGSRMVFVGSNNITLSQGTAAGATTITISGPTTAAQTVQTQGILNVALSNIGNTAGDTGLNSGTRMVLAGGNNITLSASSAANATTVTISAPTQTVQTQGVLSAGVSTGGNTAGNTTVNTGSRLVFVGTNMVSLSQTTGAGATTISINATQSVQTQSLIQALYDGANSITTGTVRLTDANGVTFSINAQTLSASVNQSISMFAVSNTTQSTSGTAHKSALSFGGAGIASVGVTGGSVVISVPAGGGAGDGGVFAGVSTFGNTAGSTGTVSTGNFVLVGSGPISLSQSTGAAGSAATVSINAPATSSLSATGGVSISTNGSTISIGVPMITHSLYNPWGDAERTPVAHGAGTLHMQPYQIPVHLQHDRVIVPMQFSQATNSTLTVTCSMWFGLYTRNASTLSLLHSQSGTFSINGSGTASSGQNSGPKHVSFGWTNTVTASDYWLGFISRTTTAGANASMSVLGNTQANSVWSGYIGSAVNASNQYQLGLGTWSASTTAVPASVGFTQLTGTGSVVQRAPMIWFLSQTA